MYISFPTIFTYLKPFSTMPFLIILFRSSIWSRCHYAVFIQLLCKFNNLLCSSFLYGFAYKLLENRTVNLYVCICKHSSLLMCLINIDITVHRHGEVHLILAFWYRPMRRVLKWNFSVGWFSLICFGNKMKYPVKLYYCLLLIARKSYVTNTIFDSGE